MADELEARRAEAVQATGFDTTLALADAQWVTGDITGAQERYEQAWESARNETERWCAWTGLAEVDPEEAWQRFATQPFTREASQLPPDDYYTALLAVGTAAGQFKATADAVAAGLAKEKVGATVSGRRFSGRMTPPPSWRGGRPGLPPGVRGPHGLPPRSRYRATRPRASVSGNTLTAGPQLWGWVAALDLLAEEPSAAERALGQLKEHRDPELTIAALYQAAAGRAPAHTRAVSARLSGKASARLGKAAAGTGLWTRATQVVTQRVASAPSATLCLEAWLEAMQALPESLDKQSTAAADTLTAACLQGLVKRAGSSGALISAMNRVTSTLASRGAARRWPWTERFFLGLLEAAKARNATPEALKQAVTNMTGTMTRSGLSEETTSEFRQAVEKICPECVTPKKG